MVRWRTIVVAAVSAVVGMACGVAAMAVDAATALGLAIAATRGVCAVVAGIGVVPDVPMEAAKSVW